VHATRAQVILVRNVPGLGSEGSLKSVPVGYFRNYLRPQGLAAFADANILEKIKRQREEEDRVRMEIKAKAQAMVSVEAQHCAQLSATCSSGTVSAHAFSHCMRDERGMSSHARVPPVCSCHAVALGTERLPACLPFAAAHPQATALATIGKFVIKKKVGEKDAIFGSVTSADLVDAIKMQVCGWSAHLVFWRGQGTQHGICCSG
jgi:ribosomal protein L9